MDVDEERPASGAEAQRMLVQWCLSAQYFSEAELHAAAERITGDAADELQATVESMNGALGPFALALRSGMEQTTGDRRWAVVSTSADPISALGTPYPPATIAVLRHLLELVVTDDGYAIGLHHAVREAAAKCPAATTRRVAEDIVQRLADDGWLTVESQWVGVGQRACIELQPYLADAYPDCMKTCCLCKEMATRGIVCAACAEVLHPHCAERLESAAALSCPACRQRMANSESFGPHRPSRQKSETPL
ncbi:hypothetical protein IWQ57_001981 [Coemansia nantahalensis]|uniref:Uncharacterized protein n=1 Tax=Coemansia nantahalensis TaxID=2789366 RepID=A0ACC1K2A8_9FUNG|nr:hypothetical protein IWQ57_001981 [Coemansia nantahalensis]